MSEVFAVPYDIFLGLHGVGSKILDSVGAFPGEATMGFVMALLSGAFPILSIDRGNSVSGGCWLMLGDLVGRPEEGPVVFGVSPRGDDFADETFEELFLGALA